MTTPQDIPAHHYFEAPHYHRPRHIDPPSVFLAGGITGCPRWHDTAVDLFRTGTPFVVLNPNRVDFPIHDPAAGAEQVRWEQHHLHAADFTLFWFPASDRKVTTQPIAMFELGQALTPGSSRRIVVGVDPDYPRAADVHLFVDLHRPGMTVWSTLADTVTAVQRAAHAEVGR